MWIFLYIVVAAFILGVFGWSAVILHQQKTAWAAFAKKHGLQYTRGKFMQAASARGVINGIRVSLFSDAQQTKDVRGERYVSVLEFEIGGGMPTGAAIGTPEMNAFIQNLAFTESWQPEYVKWRSDYIVKTRDSAALKSYLTDDRIAALLDVFGMNRVSALFFFDEKDAVLHLETVDPLRDAEKLDRIVARLLNDARRLKATELEISAAPERNIPVVVLEENMPALPVSTDPAVPSSGGEEPGALPPPFTPSL